MEKDTDKLSELSEFMGEMIEKMEKDFPFLKQQEETNVIYVDFNKEEK